MPDLMIDDSGEAAVPSRNRLDRGIDHRKEQAVRELLVKLHRRAASFVGATGIH
jgi:hypothetical protein